MATRPEKDAIEIAVREVRLIADNIRKQAAAVPNPFRERLINCSKALVIHAEVLEEILD